jgi:hypothetical protein
MRNLKTWLFAALIVLVLGGLALVATTAPSASAEEKKVVRNHWRYHDNHWSYWDDADRRWYYTDGTNWYYSGPDDDAWRVYRFDKSYGREGFERGEYKIPDENAKIVVPRHKIYRERK